ncbi:MAG: hypothetical protein M1824_001910 [Vezdaea acicularis]|nr:MAG: hypothetical protein M1824_001910 [Vezdaea acicularis]
MSRFFSSTVKAANSLKWELNGTTKDVKSLLEDVEVAINKAPGLAVKVEKGVVNGDPHSTTRADGTVDPIHISGVLGIGNLKRSNRATSFHYYPDTGYTIFSNPKYAPVRLDQTLSVTDSPYSTQLQGQIPAHQQAPEWKWDEAAQRYKYWNGTEWIWQEQS